MKKQIFKIQKHDWYVEVKNAEYGYDRTMCWFYTKKEALDWIRSRKMIGDKVQIFKLSYEFKDSFVVGEK